MHKKTLLYPIDQKIEFCHSFIVWMKCLCSVSLFWFAYDFECILAKWFLCLFTFNPKHIPICFYAPNLRNLNFVARHLGLIVTYNKQKTEKYPFSMDLIAKE